MGRVLKREMGKHSRNSSGLFSLSSAALVIISLLGNVMSVRVWELVGESDLRIGNDNNNETCPWCLWSCMALISSYEQFLDGLAEQTNNNNNY